MFTRFSRPLLPLTAIAIFAGVTFAGSAQAESVQKQCSTKYQAAKTANTLNGQTWNQFYKQCAAEMKGGTEPAATTNEPAPAAAPAAPAQKAAAPAAPQRSAEPAPAAPSATGAVFPSAVSPKYSTLSAGKARMKTCVDQYNANKAANGNGGLKWIMKGGGYYSECNKRLKGEG
jgi:hypothetical protein